MKKYGEINDERRNKAGNTDFTWPTQRQSYKKWCKYGNRQRGNLMFFDTATYNRSKGKEFDGFRVNINDLVK